MTSAGDGVAPKDPLDYSHAIDEVGDRIHKVVDKGDHGEFISDREHRTLATDGFPAPGLVITGGHGILTV